ESQNDRCRHSLLIRCGRAPVPSAPGRTGKAPSRQLLGAFQLSEAVFLAEVPSRARSATRSPICNQGCRSQTELSTTSTGSRDAKAAGAFTMGQIGRAHV